jgi:hypothetical protein
VAATPVEFAAETRRRIGPTLPSLQAHERRRYNLATYESYFPPSNRASLDMCSLGPLGRMRTVRGRQYVPPRGRVNDCRDSRIIRALHQRTHAVFIPPALKSFQHLRCDLSLEGLCRGNKRALRDLEISAI